ncbi:MAG TPA: hypothetical protein VEK38_00540 [Candidatus Bathyarchaeia archaeon]|nr:hypothetical protein [Candidatus Bathyarchaeia archaeon]
MDRRKSCWYVRIIVVSTCWATVQALERNVNIVEYPLYSYLAQTSYCKRGQPCKPGWNFVLNGRYEGTQNCFDSRGNKVSLSYLIFGKTPITLQDMFLLCGLTSSGKVSNSAEGSLGQVRPADSTAPYGAYANDFYTTLLAQTKMIFDAEQRTFGFDVTLAYRWCLSSNTNISLLGGVLVPVRQILRILEPRFDEGSLFAGLLETTTDFFTDYTDVEDFFDTGIAMPKGTVLQRRQRKIGVGDTSLFLFFDWAWLTRYVEDLQFGLNLIFPTGGRENPSKVWSIVFGNGGAFAIDFFSQVYFATPTPYLSPFVKLGIIANAPYTNVTRVPQQVTQSEPTALLDSVQGLIIPPKLAEDGFFVTNFQAFDSDIRELTDNAVPVRTRLGVIIDFWIGNYAYDVFLDQFIFGLFYAFSYQSKDKATISSGQSGVFDTTVLTDNTRSISHGIVWDVTYETATAHHGVEISLTGKNILAGKNIAQTNELVVSFVISF